MREEVRRRQKIGGTYERTDCAACCDGRDGACTDETCDTAAGGEGGEEESLG